MKSKLTILCENSVGVPFGVIGEHGFACFVETEMVEVGPGVYLTGEIPRKSAFEKGDVKMSAIRPDGETVHPDPIKDDLSLIIDSNKGLIIVLGCAHAGMINIIEYALAKMKKDRIPCQNPKHT